mmetsp:Transcript_30175/g.97106  ORF Transcript_30175/g.97106 Transcript_30175/m.97106 type:complete len:117 (+) Transcript_30175:612-962(+)
MQGSSPGHAGCPDLHQGWEDSMMPMSLFSTLPCSNSIMAESCCSSLPSFLLPRPPPLLALFASILSTRSDALAPPPAVDMQRPPSSRRRALPSAQVRLLPAPASGLTMAADTFLIP